MYTSKSELKHLMRVVDARLMQSDALYALAVGATTSSARQHGALRQQRDGPLAPLALGPARAVDPAAVGNASAYLPLVGNGRAQSALMTHHDAATGTGAYNRCVSVCIYLGVFCGALGWTGTLPRFSSLPASLHDRAAYIQCSISPPGE
jgi:hypothetical protein